MKRPTSTTAAIPVRRKSGPQVKPPRLMWHAKKKYWFILDRGKQISCGTKIEAEANVFFGNYLLGKKDCGGAKLRPILEKAARLDRVYSWIYERLLEDWSGKRVRDVTPDTCKDWYRLNRKARGLDPDVDLTTVNDSSGRHFLKLLLARVRAECRPMNPEYKVRGWQPKEGLPRQRFLFADEVARFVHVALGRKVDPEAPDGWARDPSTGVFLYEDAEIRARWAPVARYVMIGVFSASRRAAILNLRWKPEKGCGHVDFMRSLMYRTDAERGNALKANPTVRMHVKLRRFLYKCWLHDKAEGVATNIVVHTPTGHSSRVQDVWNEVRKIAGFGDDVVRHTLRHTCATLLLADGVPEAEVAALLGITIENLLTHYAQVHPRLTDWVADVMDEAARGCSIEHSLERHRPKRKHCKVF